MRFSRWCHVFQRGDVSALVNSLTLSVVYVPTGKLQNCDDIEQLLVSEHLAVGNPTDDESLFTMTRERLRSRMSLELMYLLLTDGCNLKCVYCFEETPSLVEPFRSTQMTSETVTRALDLFATMVSKHGDPEQKKVIHLYGGEPLANRKAVYEAVHHIDNLKKRQALPGDCQIVIVTNGVLLNEGDAHLFAEHKVSVGLSIDGPAFITDGYRIPKRQGVQVTERVTKAFRLLKHYGVSVGLSVTLTPLAIEHFDKFLDFFTIGEFSKVDGVSLNLLHFNPRVVLPNDYYDSAVKCQIAAFERFREAGIYEERVMRKAQSFINREPIYADCGVVGRQLVIAPDGRVGVCPDFVKPRTYFPCSVYDKNSDDLLETLFRDWRERSPFFMPQCVDCPALGICGGGCPASAELKTGNRQNLDERACYHSRKILEWLVWDAYANIG